MDLQDGIHDITKTAANMSINAHDSDKTTGVNQSSQDDLRHDSIPQPETATPGQGTSSTEITRGSPSPQLQLRDQACTKVPGNVVAIPATATKAALLEPNHGQSAFTFPPTLLKYNVPAEDYLLAHTDTQVLATGIAVFARDTSGLDHMLLVQRSKSDSYPGRWEIPGGSVDMTGETILEAAARELKEETGLTVSKFVRDMDIVRFSTGRNASFRWWNKFSFEVEVKESNVEDGAKDERSKMDRVGAKVKLDEKEHQAWLWASVEDVQKESSGETKLRFVTREQHLIMLDAFAQRKERESEGVVEATTPSN
jgi:8-oxo-dGTP pyrophosphatase MutT (NUDIX family)